MAYTQFSFALFLSAIMPIFGQLKEQPADVPVTTYTISYPQFMGVEQHKELGATLQLDKNLEVDLQLFYDTHLLENRFRTSATVRYQVTKKIYVIGGAELETRLGHGKNASNLPARPSATLGFGYEVSNDFYLEAKGNFALKNNVMGAYGEAFPMPQIYTLGGKVKF